jgi:hypothetical protein
MKNLAIFYHALLFKDAPENLLENALNIVLAQMWQLRPSGLLDVASEFHVGLNGGVESLQVARLILPAKAQITLHGLQCHTENRTILMLEKWLPGHEDWYVLYFHTTGAGWPPDDELRTRWRGCMMKWTVSNWRRCVADLDGGYDAVGVHWMEPPTVPPGQHYFGGTFFWAKASFLLTLPSIMARDRIKLSGLDAHESRGEAEVWIGNGSRLPKVKDYHGPGWTPAKIGECTP